MRLHIMPVDVVHDEGKGVQQGKNEEGIGDPSVEDLEPFMGHSRQQCDPVCLCCRGTNEGQHRSHCKEGSTHNTNGMQPKASHPDLVASGGEPPNFSSDQ